MEIVRQPGLRHFRSMRWVPIAVCLKAEINGMNHTLLKMDFLIPRQLFSIFSNLIRICNRDGPTCVYEHADADLGNGLPLMFGLEVSD